MKAMILAAGLGTRLRPLTDTTPKALVRVNGRTLLEHVTSNLEKAGFERFVVNVHHLAGQIEEYLAENPELGAKFEVSRESELLDTGGGIKHARPYLDACGHFLVHNVDIFSNLDLRKMVASAPEDALSMLLVSERKTSRYLLFDDSLRLVGWTNVDTGEVKSPYGKIDPSSCRKLAFGGIHYLSDKVFPLMENWPDKFSIIDFYLQNAKNHPVYAYVQDDLKLIDVGKASVLDRVSEFLNELGATA